MIPHSSLRRRWSLQLLLPLTVLAIPLSLSWSAPPANDDIGSALTVAEPLPFSDALSTVEATNAADDPDCVGSGPTVWYVYTPSAGGWINANTIGSGYDTTLSMYTGSPGSLTQVACNDDTPGFWPASKLIVEVSAGTTYYFMIGAFASGPGGDLVFNVEDSPPPAVVELSVTEPLAVDPSTGTATVHIQASASSPVFVYGSDFFLVQPAGRGNVVGINFDFPWVETDYYEVEVDLKDAYTLKERGAGFVGGKARLVVAFYYEDPVTGFQFLQFDKEVQLTGKRKP